MQKALRRAVVINAPKQARAGEGVIKNILRRGERKGLCLGGDAQERVLKASEVLRCCWIFEWGRTNKQGLYVTSSRADVGSDGAADPGRRRQRAATFVSPSVQTLSQCGSWCLFPLSHSYTE